MGSWSKVFAPLTQIEHLCFPSSSSSSSSSPTLLSSILVASTFALPTRLTPLSSSSSALLSKNRGIKHICRAAEYKFPDPIPEFADAETEKFRTHLRKRLIKKDCCGDSLYEVVEICTEILSNFLHTEYGGPGTLLVIPFIDMADTVDERGLPGGPQAARSAVVWAQNNIDKDWKEWNDDNSN